MAHEIETKVLDIDSATIEERLHKLGAERVLDTRLIVDWYRPAGLQDGDNQWYLRIRSRSDGSAEITWKGKSTALGVSHSRREINVPLTEPVAVAELFEAIDLVP